MKTMKVDRTAARLLLGAVTDLSPGDLAAITMPTLVLCGDKDRDNCSTQSLVDALPNARLQEVPGTHMGSVTEAALGHAIARYLTA
jgi:pimeloyl-ACP methyl ester carboxylesterase